MFNYNNYEKINKNNSASITMWVLIIVIASLFFTCDNASTEDTSLATAPPVTDIIDVYYSGGNNFKLEWNSSLLTFTSEHKSKDGGQLSLNQVEVEIIYIQMQINNSTQPPSPLEEVLANGIRKPTKVPASNNEISLVDGVDVLGSTAYTFVLRFINVTDTDKYAYSKVYIGVTQ